MAGTNPVAAFLRTVFTTQDPATYKAAIDGNFAVAQRLVGAFAPHQSATPNMTVTLDAGPMLSGVTLTEVAQQVTGTITAPVTNPRIDRVVVDSTTGAVSVVTGAENASPVAPAIPTGKLPVARVALVTSSTAITNNMLTDERVSGITPSTLSYLLTILKAGDFMKVSQDASPLRWGCWGQASGSLYTLLSGLSASDVDMCYWTHNIAIDTANGNFAAAGRDDTGACMLYVFTENGFFRIFNAVSAAAGTAPTWTLVYTFDTSTGNIFCPGLVAQSATAFTTGGTSTAYTLTPAPALTVQAANQRFRVKFHTASGASPTLVPSGLTAKSLKQYDSSGAKVAAVTATGQLADVEDDGTDYVILDPLPSAPVAGIPAGTIINFAGTSPPSGYLTCPTSATNISRTTYAALFAAIGTTWGVGDGSTTFGLPWFAADYAAVQANSNVGTSTVGAVIAHTHPMTAVQSSGAILWNPAAAQGISVSGTTGSTGGAANLAAGVRVLKCIKY